MHEGADETFCAGDDINEMPVWGNADQVMRRARLYQGMANSLKELDKLTIAAVDGFAVGGGLKITMACDFVIATRRARWGMPEIDVGITPGWGGTTRMARLIGRRMTKEVNLLGALHPARRALELGLWNRVVEDDRLVQEVDALVELLLSKNQQAARQLKFIVNRGVEADQYTAQGFEALSAALSGAVNDPGGSPTPTAGSASSTSPRRASSGRGGAAWRRTSGRIPLPSQRPTRRRAEGNQVSVEPHQAVIVGAGAAGLGVAAELTRRGVEPLLLERAEEIGASWRARYPTLRLNNDRWSSRLPRSFIPRRAGRWPARDRVHRLSGGLRSAIRHPLRCRRRAHRPAGGELVGPNINRRGRRVLRR